MRSNCDLSAITGSRRGCISLRAGLIEIQLNTPGRSQSVGCKGTSGCGNNNQSAEPHAKTRRNTYYLGRVIILGVRLEGA